MRAVVQEMILHRALGPRMVSGTVGLQSIWTFS